MNSFIHKKRARVLSFALALFIIAALAPSGARAVDDPETSSVSVLVMDLDADRVLYSRNDSERRAVASLTKIMTVLLACEAYDNGTAALSDIVTVGSDVYFDITDDGSTLNLKPGEELTFEQLLYCAMIASANESCNVLAEYLAESVPAFVERMNARARELGCTDTNFTNTHGMPSEGQYTTAHDLAIISRAALKLSLFKRLCSTTSYTVPATNMSEARALTNSNGLINPQSYYYYEYASGIKTGYTDAAGYCLVSTAVNDGRQLLCVVLGGESFIAEDGRTLTTNYTDTRTLLNWAFGNFSYQEILSTLRLVTELPVELGLGTSTVILRPETSIKALLPNDADLTKVVVTPTYFREGPLTAPVEQGTVLGEISVSFDGVDYGKVNLIANTTVELDRTAYMLREIRDTLSNKYVRLGITLILVLIILYAAFIVYYNIRRQAKRRAAAELARERIEYIRAVQSPAPTERRERMRETTIGKSFEEIEAAHRRREEEQRPRR